MFQETSPWTFTNVNPFPSTLPGEEWFPPTPMAMSTADGGVVAAVPALDGGGTQAALIGQFRPPMGDPMWPADAGGGGTVLFSSDPAEGDLLGLEAPTYNAAGLVGRWAAFAFVTVAPSGARCLNFWVADTLTSASLIADGAQVTGSCPNAHLPTWVAGSGNIGYLGYSDWEDPLSGTRRAMFGRTEGTEVDPSTGVFEHAAPALFPRISVDPRNGAPVLAWLQEDGVGDFDFRVERWTLEMDAAPGWDDNGMRVNDPSENLPLEDTPMLPPAVVAPDGGLVLALTNAISAAHKEVVVRRIDDGP
jgi:hypothetical protein